MERVKIAEYDFNDDEKFVLATSPMEVATFDPKTRRLYKAVYVYEPKHDVAVIETTAVPQRATPCFSIFSLLLRIVLPSR